MRSRYKVIFLLIVTKNAFGASYTWDGTTAEWTTNSNWTPSGPPAINDTAIFSDAAPNKAVSSSGPMTAGQLIFTSSDPYSITSGSSLTFDNIGDAIINVSTLPTANHALFCPVILNDTLRLTGAASTIFEMHGPISGNGGIIVNTDLQLFSANSFAGSLTVFGTLDLQADNAIPSGNAVTLFGQVLKMNNTTQTADLEGIVGSIDLGTGTLTLQNSASRNYVNPISGTTGTVNIDIGNFTLIFSGNNTYQGTTNLQTGVFVLGSSSALGTSSFNMSSGTVFNMNGFSRTFTATNFSDTSGSFIALGGAQVTFDTAAPLTVHSLISGSGSLVKGGGSSLTLSATNTYTDGTTINSGAVVVGIDNALPDGKDLTFLSGTLSLSGFNQNIGNVVSNPGTSINLQSGSLGVLATTPTVLVSNLVGPGILNQRGPATLTISGTNTHTLTNVNNSTLIIGSKDALLTNSSVILQGVGSFLDFNNFDATLATFTAFAGANINLGSATVTYTGSGFGVNNMSGSITGTQNSTLAKVGTRTFFLGAVNSYGQTISSAGILRTGVVGALPFGRPVTLTGGTLQLNNFDQTVGAFTGASGATLSLGTATLTVATETDCTVASTITGTGRLIKSGSGALSLTGSGDLVEATVSQGDLLVNGSLTSPITVDGSGRLGGIGTITGDVVVNGTMAPGNSIGTTTIIGNYTQSSGSTFEAEISPNDADLLDVSLAVTIEPNANLNIVITPGSYLPTTYTIINAASGVTGTFQNVIKTGSIFVNPTPIYLATQVDLELTTIPLNQVFTSGNTAAIASCLVGSIPANTLLSHITSLLSESTSLIEAVELIEALNPNPIKTLTLAQEESSFLLQGLIRNRMVQFTESSNCPLQAGLNLWLDGTYETSRQKSKKDLIGYHTDGGILALGLDYLTEENLFFGLSVAYSSSHLSFNNSRGSGHVNGYFGNLYTGVYNTFAFANLSLLGAYVDYIAHRNINVEPIYSAYSHHGGGEFDAALDIGLYWQDSHFYVSPYILLDYLFLQEDSFKEKRAGNAGVSVRSCHYNVLRSFLGLDLNYNYTIKENPASLQLGLAYGYEARFDGNDYKANFLGQPCVFRVEGLNPSRFLVIPEITLEHCFPKENFAFLFNYQASLNPSFCDQAFSLELLY